MKQTAKFSNSKSFHSIYFYDLLNFFLFFIVVVRSLPLQLRTNKSTNLCDTKNNDPFYVSLNKTKSLNCSRKWLKLNYILSSLSSSSVWCLESFFSFFKSCNSSHDNENIKHIINKIIVEWKLKHKALFIISLWKQKQIETKKKFMIKRERKERQRK